MPQGKGRPKIYRDGVLADIAKVHRWNYCQKISQLLYHGALTDEEIKMQYAREVSIFNDDTK